MICVEILFHHIQHTPIMMCLGKMAFILNVQAVWISWTLQNLINSLFYLQMEIEKEKSSKIFNLQAMSASKQESDEQYLNMHWEVIQSAVITFMVKEISGQAIIKLKRSLQALLMRNKYAEIHQNLIRLFYQIYKELLSRFVHESNCLLTLLAYYTSKKQNYRILFDLLNNYLAVYSQNDPQTIEEKAYKILCKEIINSHLSEKIANELLLITHRFRTTNDPNQIIELQYQLKIISFLGIYTYCDLQFLERSKLYFVNFSQQIPKNQEIFNIINESIKREVALNKILKPSENTMKYLQKSLIEEYFPFMIEYVDYLIQQNKLDKLKMLWENCLRLGQKDRNLLEVRLRQIVRDISKYLKGDKENLHAILDFINKFVNIIQVCFDSNKLITNILYNTIQQILGDNQKIYNDILSKKVFNPSPSYSHEVISQLFKLLPNKERFIKQFQIRFFRWILNNDDISMHFQEQFVQMIKKQCGFGLCKKIDRMIYDVWRDGNMYYNYHPAKNFRCRLISSNDWPKFNYLNINLPDTLNQIIVQFQHEFRKEEENKHKQLTWINEFGTIQLAINGVVSLFSQYQAAIIFALDKSFRPMKKNQLIEILQGSQSVISEVIDVLHQGNILILNQMNQTYQINDENHTPFKVVKEEKANMEQIKTLSKRDDTIIIEACIVRIMKKRKTIPKTQISKFIFDQINSFKPTVEQINQALERLVSRDFIEIDKMRGTIRYRE